MNAAVGAPVFQPAPLWERPYGRRRRSGDGRSFRRGCSAMRSLRANGLKVAGTAPDRLRVASRSLEEPVVRFQRLTAALWTPERFLLAVLPVTFGAQLGV